MQQDQDTAGKAGSDDGGATRPQRGGEGGTTRFGMEDGDGTVAPAAGTDPDRRSPAE